jgi:hypothetical protein
MSDSDMSIQPDIFTQAVNHFVAEDEEVKAAAAFAAGKPRGHGRRLQF